MHVGISICAEHATASRAQTDNVAPPHHSEELGDQEDNSNTGNSQGHNWRTAGTAGWFAHTPHGKR